MFRAATAPTFTPRLRPPRGRPRRYPLVRRDPRRFARGMMRLETVPAAAPADRSDWRFFAHSFGAGFLFVSLLIA
jgi:hypothetical protein